jgi:hypothetical protein
MKKRTLITAILAVALVSAAVFVAVRREFIQDKILDAVIKKLQPSLPFQIESYDLSKDLKYLSIHLRWNQYPIEIAGALNMKFHGPGKGWTVRYAPAIQFDTATPVHVVLNLEANSEFSTIRSLQVQSDSEYPDSAFVSKALGVDLKTPVLNLNFVPGKEKTTHFDFKADSVMWTDPTHDQHAISLQAPKISADLKGEAAEASFSSTGSEMLWDAYYADVPMANLPIHLKTPDLKNFAATVGLHEELQVGLKTPNEAGDAALISWTTQKVSFGPVASWILKTLPPALVPMQGWSDLELKGGTVETSGSAFLPGKKSGFQLREIDLNAAKISFRSLSHHLTAKQVSFSTQYRQSDSVHRASFEAQQIYFKKVPARLKKTEITWSDTTFKTSGPVGLEVQSVPMTLGAIDGAFGKTEDDAYQFTTSLKVNPTNLSFLNAGLCLPPDRLPPTQAQVDFPTIEFSPGVIDPTGKITLDLFQGKVELNDIGFYDLSTEVPEIDFDVEWSGIDMQTLGDWTHFGEIKGSLEGYAHNVVFQSFLPTQYQFFIHVSPLSGKKFVEFSPEAMKNFVKIFTGEDLDEQIPGVAGWLMFGWPSRVFGGYDVQYAGISLDSQDGLIEVQTLDPPEVVKDTQKHFILYGFRFKMPIRSPNYPLVIDATAMSNFVHQLVSRFGSLKGDTQNEDTQCNPPEL